ncbi:MAG: ABC transporter permease, partial [Alistipes sp.]|nr:ABC transporter permease [Alistipes sp.]
MKWLAKIYTKRSNWSLPYLIFLLLFVVLPLVLIFLYAFQDNDGNFTLDNFSKFISNPEAANTFVYSIGVAIITTLLCILLGYPAAYILSNRDLCRSRVMVVL